MKKAYFKNLMRTIIHTKARFLSIFCIVFLGAAFFSGLRQTPMIMKASMDAFLQEHQYNDLEYIGTLGYVEEDIEALKDISKIADIDYGIRFDALIKKDKDSHGVTVYTRNDFTHHVNMPKMVEGKLPTKEQECLLDARYAANYGYQLKDEIVLENNQGSKTYTIVGLVHDSRYVNSVDRGTNTLGDGSNSAFLIMLTKGNETFALPQELYDLRNETVLYNDIRITIKDRENIFSKDYMKDVKEVEAKVTKILKSRYDTLNIDIKNEASKSLLDATSQYEEGSKQYQEGLALYEDGYQQYLDGKAKYANGLKQYQEGQLAYLDGWNQLEAGKQAYEDGLKDYQNGYQQYLFANQQYDQGLQVYLDMLNQGIPADTPQMQEMKQQLDQTKQMLDQSKIQLDQTKQILDNSEISLSINEAKLNESKGQLEQSASLLNQTKETLDNTEIELRNSKQELDQAKLELEDAKKQIDQGQSEMENIPTGSIVTLTKEENSGIVSYDSNCDAIEGLSLLFPLIFFLVAALVSLTTMTRMVEEQRVQSGIYRALGYQKKDVIQQYLIYAFLATFFASVLGMVFGTYFFPNIIVYLYRTMMYDVDFSCKIVFDMMICMQAFVISVCITLVVTWWVCYQELSAMPAVLIRPKAPKLGKRILLERITFIWKRLSFNQKVTMRNIFRYKKRFFMSIIGIAGCSALIVTAFGIKGSIATLADSQYNEIWHYDGLIHYDITNDEIDTKKLEDDIAKQPQIQDVCNYYNQNVLVNDDYYAVLEVPSDDKKFETFVTLNDYQHNKDTLSLRSDGIYINAKLAELLDVKTGDSISIELDAKQYKLKVNGVYELYFRHYIYMTPELYQSLTGKQPIYTGAYYNMKEVSSKNETAMTTYIHNTKGIASIEFVDSFADAFRDQMESINSVVIILMICAGSLAFIVLYNLTNINIQERKSEIATIKVLGFYPREVYDYVFRENIWLSVIGAIVGLFFGKLLHGYLIRLVEVDVAMFIRTVDWKTYIIALFITFVFTKLINLFMRKVLNQIDMVESLKSIE